MTLNVRVREDILTSWQRCVVAGLRPDHFEVPYQPDFDHDGPLRWAAAPILDQVATDGAGEMIGVVDLTCAARDFNSLLLPFAKRAAREIGHRLREGVNVRRLPARSWLSLTGTERTVAHLAAQGLSSRVVAECMRLPQPTVRSHLRRVFRRLGVGSQVELARAVEQCAARDYIVSEALANVAKHANAQMVMVSVEAGRGVLSLSDRDDGVGGADPNGSGLTGLRERAEALGGTLKLTSPPGRGTRVDVRLPGAAR